MLEGMAGDYSGNILTYSFLFFLFYLLAFPYGRGYAGKVLARIEG
jgi:hypothetical protein